MPPTLSDCPENTGPKVEGTGEVHPVLHPHRFMSIRRIGVPSTEENSYLGSGKDHVGQAFQPEAGAAESLTS